MVIQPGAQWRVPHLRLPWLLYLDSTLKGGQFASPSPGAARWTLEPCKGKRVCFISVCGNLQNVCCRVYILSWWAVSYLLRISLSLRVKVLAHTSFVSGSFSSAFDTSICQSPNIALVLCRFPYWICSLFLLRNSVQISQRHQRGCYTSDLLLACICNRRRGDPRELKKVVLQSSYVIIIGFLSSQT